MPPSPRAFAPPGYFQLLEQVFATQMRDPKNKHLETFFILVPSLTINFVEHLLAAKDRL